MNIKSVLESLLFAWGEPLSLGEISKLLDIPERNISAIFDEMIEHSVNNKDSVSSYKNSATHIK